VHRFNKEVLPTLPPRDRHEKVIAAAESGGKGTIIVDADADPEEAAQGIFDSKFGFQGQKCSADDRVIVVGSSGLYGEIVHILHTKILNMKRGTPEIADNFMGPMIDSEAREKVEQYKKIAEEEGTVIGARSISTQLYNSGYFVGPMIVADLPANSRVWQEEIFGPVLAMARAESFEEALAMANDSEFGLTGGVYTNNDEHWQMAVEQFEVGNLYRNRKISGAVVVQNPFGGYKMSGNSTKAGGWDYLLHFVRRKNLCSRV